MLQSSNQVPTPVPNTLATTMTTANPMPHIPVNDNNVWPTQSKPLIPPMVQQPHGMNFDKYN